MIRDLSPESLSKKISKSLKSVPKNSTKIREYGVGAQILSDLGVKKMTLLSNSKKIAAGLKGFDLSIINWEKLD